MTKKDTVADNSAEKAAGKASEKTIIVTKVEKGEFDAYIVGDSPLLMQKMSEKTKRDLLFPPLKKNKTERETTLKHEPRREFRDAAYVIDDGPTYLGFPAAGFKMAMTNAALDLSGAAKSQVGRLTWVLGELVPIYGLPTLHMAGVIDAGFNRSPNIRTWCMVREWAAKLTVEYVSPNLTPEAVANLLGASGVFVGIGDGRPQKGHLSNGRFRLVAKDDPDYLRIVKHGGRSAQEEGMKACIGSNDETRRLLEWFDAELVRRRQKVNLKKEAAA